MKKLKNGNLEKVVGGFQPIANAFPGDDEESTKDPKKLPEPKKNPTQPVANPGFRWPPKI